MDAPIEPQFVSLGKDNATAHIGGAWVNRIHGYLNTTPDTIRDDVRVSVHSDSCSQLLIIGEMRAVVYLTTKDARDLMQALGEVLGEDDAL